MTCSLVTQLLAMAGGAKMILLGQLAVIDTASLESLSVKI